MNIAALTDNTLRVTLASLRATDFLVEPSVRPMHAAQVEAFDQERQRRGLSEGDLYHDMGYPERVALTERNPRGKFTHTPTEEDLGAFDLSDAPDDEVRFFYGLGAEIADFSCLGRGVRDHAEMPWSAGRAELDKRGIETKFFCDLELS